MSSIIAEEAGVDSAGNDAIASDVNERTRLIQSQSRTGGRSKQSTIETITESSGLESDSELDEDDSYDPNDADEQHSRRNEEYVGLPWYNRPSATVLIIIFFLFNIGVSIVAASNLDVMLELVCRSLYDTAPSHEEILDGQDPRCRSAEVTAVVATFTSYRTTILGLMGIVVTPKLASYSDRFGRKWALLWGTTCAMLAELISYICTSYPESIDYHFLLLSSVLQGLGGSILTIQVLNSSYVADCVPPSLRAKTLGMLDSCLYGAFAVGPIIGSVLLQNFKSLSKLYLISACFLGASSILILTLLSESRPLKARRMSQAKFDADYEQVMNDNTNWRKYLHKVNFLKPLKLLAFGHLKNPVSRRNAIMLVCMESIGMGFSVAVSPILLMYAELKFKWTSVETGYMLSMFGISRVLILALAFPVFLRFLRSRYRVIGNGIDKVDLSIIRIGLLFTSIGYTTIGNAPTSKLFLYALVMDSLAGIQIPAMKNAIIKHAPQDRVGELLGGLSLVNNFCLVIGPLIFFKLFNLTVAIRPQLVFEVVAATSLCLLITSFFLTNKPTEIPSPAAAVGEEVEQQ